jgi:hypothetical protein
MTETVDQARTRIRAEAAEGCRCPVCTRIVKVYRRRIHREMVVFLARLRRCCDRGRDTGAFYGPRDVRGDGAKASTDGVYLAHWGLIECEKTATGAPRRGRYRVTPRGRLFLDGSICVPAVALFLCGDHIGFEEAMCDVNECFGETFIYGGSVW